MNPLKKEMGRWPSTRKCKVKQNQRLQLERALLKRPHCPGSTLARVERNGAAG